MKTINVTHGLCTNCEKESEFDHVIRSKSFKVRGEDITVEIVLSRCTQCGDEVLDPAFNDPFELAYKEYRRKHALLQPQEISSWRKAHHLSQAELARLLGFGIATLNRYENGSLQNESHESSLDLPWIHPFC